MATISVTMVTMSTLVSTSISKNAYLVIVYMCAIFGAYQKVHIFFVKLLDYYSVNSYFHFHHYTFTTFCCDSSIKFLHSKIMYNPNFDEFSEMVTYSLVGLLATTACNMTQSLSKHTFLLWFTFQKFSFPIQYSCAHLVQTL